ncbi:MAG: NUDIX domain-containing protein [Candidatus Pacebacteria bacterium]|nr:NUDIX domain-containing protein [Candidatus Paceibacterota bacterium]
MKISKDAQAVVFRKNTDGINFLLLKRYDKEKERTDYRLIKGGVEKEEKPEETVIREIKEESGLENLSLLNKLGEYSYQAGDVLHEVSVFLAENTKDDEIKMDSENEGGFTIEGAEWIPSEKVNSYLVFDQEKDSIKKALDLI